MMGNKTVDNRWLQGQIQNLLSADFRKEGTGYERRKKQSRYNDRNKNSEMKKRRSKADANVKTMEDFTSPEILYDELIASVKKYHPSTDISMIEKAYKIAYEGT